MPRIAAQLSCIASQGNAHERQSRPGFRFFLIPLSLAPAGGRRKCRQLQIEQGQILLSGLNSSFKVQQDGAAMSAKSRRVSRFAQVRFGGLDPDFDLFAARCKLISHVILPLSATAGEAADHAHGTPETRQQYGAA
jgi:hypothetical protein